MVPPSCAPEEPPLVLELALVLLSSLLPQAAAPTANAAAHATARNR
jgi:hypothetical protein